MTKILEIKNRIIKIIENYETYVNIIFKFIVAFSLFSVINENIGYMTRLTSAPVVLLLSLVCSILPSSFILVIASILVLLHIYTLSLEAAVVTLILILIIYLIYFRFSPREGIAAALSPVLLQWGIPYILPVACGLLRKICSVISILCGTVLYYYLVGIKTNETAFTVVIDEDTEISSRFSIAIAQLTGNNEMFLTCGVFLVATIVVYLVRRLNVEYAWYIAIVSGILVQFGGMFAGYMILNITGKYISLVVGSILSLLIAFVIQFFCMNLDYARTERVQFEDDEYYYYVKAIPKKQVPSEERTIKHFGNTASMGRRIERHNREDSDIDEDISRQVIAQELDIDEDQL